MAAVILMKKAGLLIPADLMKKSQEAFPTAFGMCIAANGECQPMQQVEPMKMEELLAFQEELKEYPALFVFEKITTKYHKDDVQPSPLLYRSEGNKNCVLVGAAVGDFSRYSQPDSVHTPEFFFFNTKVLPDLHEMWRMQGEDWDKFKQYLNSGMLARGLVHDTFKGSGAVVLFDKDGNSKVLNQGVAVSEFDWGWTTDSLGYSSKAAEPAKKEEPKKEMSHIERLRAKLAMKNEKTVETTQPPIEEKKTETAVPPPTEVPVLPDATTADDDYVQVIPKSNNNGNVKSWYRLKDNGGKLPQNWRDKPPILKLKNKVNPEVDVIVDKNKSPIKDLKDERLKDVKTTSQQAVIKDIAIIPAEQKTVIQKWMTEGRLKPYMEKYEGVIQDPKEVQKEESRLADFVQVNGLKDIAQTYNWPHSILAEMQKVTPDAFLVLAETWRLKLIKLEMLLQAAVRVEKGDASKDAASPQRAAM